MKPIVQPLAYWQRKLIFIFLLISFLLSLPVFIFYATGYRYDFFSETPTITATGGLYLNASYADSKIYIDESEITNARVFRNALYIQGLQPGLHRVHVQAEGLDTWVKNLAIYPHIVTEAESFNLPVQPHIRPVTRYQTVKGEAVFFRNSTSSSIFMFATTTELYILATSTATSTYLVDPEYTLLNELFQEKASTTMSILKNKKNAGKFGFATTSADTLGQEVATTTVTRNSISLYEKGEDIFVQALGTGNQVPHYFCLDEVLYGYDIELDQNLEEADIPVNTVSEITKDLTACRKEIRIDRKWQTVHDFTFFPGSESLVLMNLDNGIYVVEVDDRSWQNTQVLYPGTGLVMLVYGNSIFVKDGNLILEVLTQIAVK